MRSSFLCSVVFLAIAGLAHCQAACIYYPPNGFVPDAATAVRIAQAVGVPAFGAASVKDKTFKATLAHGIWSVYGTPIDGVGDEAIIRISKKSGAILGAVLAHVVKTRTAPVR